ncbi:MAG: nucleotide exchange factor GrpE [Firmicutes bacterium]|nr:nucleotide exchange factor GrpE [Bacillota bacterium]
MNNNFKVDNSEHENTETQLSEEDNRSSPDSVDVSEVEDSEKPEDVECAEGESESEQVDLKQVQQLIAEREKLVNQILRLKADFDNYRRRNNNLISDIRATANQNLVEELLPVIDNFERAINSASADSSYIIGVKMIFDQLMDCLTKHGLEVIDAVGKPFDPNLHEAVSLQGDSADDLIVTAELQKGYIFKDKLLRASMVQVAPEKQQEEEE